MHKRLVLPLLLWMFAIGCSAQEPPSREYTAGEQYTVIASRVPRTAPGDGIEVVEFFWYRCPHCYRFEPMLQAWAKKQPADVNFRPTPAVFREVMALHARAYFTADALGVLDKLHPALFRAMNVEHKTLETVDDIAAIFTANGVARAEFDKTFDSFGVTSQVTQAVAAGKASGLSGTPSMMVAGKYLVDSIEAGGQAQMLQVVDYLVAKERAASAGNQAAE